jgi:hypothetical protein
VTTAAGLREMLKKMYVKDCKDKDVSEVVQKQIDDKSTGANWWVEADEEYSPRMSLQPRQESYCERIRGNTDGIIMGFCDWVTYRETVLETLQSFIYL